MPSGEVHHIKFRLKAEGKRSLKRAVLIDDGAIVHVSEADWLFWDAYREIWGTTEITLATQLHRNGPLQVPVAFFFQNEEFPAWAASNKLDVEYIDGPLKIGVFYGGAPEIQKIARHDDVSMLALAAEGWAENQDPDSQGAAHHSRAASHFNDNGYYAEDIKIGIIEANTRCRLMEHEAFQNNSVTYQTNAVSCQNNQDCVNACDVPNAFCRDGGICVSQHATHVASRIAHTSHNENNASRAHLFVANVGEITPNTSTPAAQNIQALVDRLEWLLEEEVMLINESWGPGNLFVNQVSATFQSSLEDYYSFHHNMTFVNAAGNSDDFVPHLETNCHSFNSICVGAVGAAGTYDDDRRQYEDDIWSGFAWKNPWFTHNSGNPLATFKNEPERPDVVSEGVDAVVASVVTAVGQYPGTDVWETNTGTSFAAPTVTASLALLQECRRRTLWPIHNKVLVRNTADVDQQVEVGNPTAPSTIPRYPTPGHFTSANTIHDEYDSRAGAGIHHAAGMSCREEGCAEKSKGQCADGSATHDLRDGIPWPTNVDVEDLQADPTPIPSGLVFDADPGEFSDPLTVELHNLGEVESGTRVRASLSWFGCSPDEPNGAVGQLGVGVDYDLLLCDLDGSDAGCEFASESLTDSNEGFDVITGSNRDNLSLLLVWNSREFRNGSWENTLGCGETTLSRYAWALRSWTP